MTTMITIDMTLTEAKTIAGNVLGRVGFADAVDFRNAAHGLVSYAARCNVNETRARAHAREGLAAAAVLFDHADTLAPCAYCDRCECQRPDVTRVEMGGPDGERGDFRADAYDLCGDCRDAL
jgi:hypothetical protein